MRIGVVIPAYNAAWCIGDAIVSVLEQTHCDWELVVVDDGSTDGTGDLAKHYAGSRIRLVRQNNAGVAAARNRGIAELEQFPTGGAERVDASLFLDADDWLAPDALARLAAALSAAPGCVAACGAYSVFGGQAVRTPQSGDLLKRLLVRNLFANGGHLLIRAAAVRAAGGFRTGIAYGEDWEFCIRLALLGPFTAVADNRPVLFVRQHRNSAYRRLAADSASFIPCMDAIFSNAALLNRFGAPRLARIRRRTEAENAWIVGRELIRHQSAGPGRRWLGQSVRAYPAPKRIVLLAASYLLPLLPPAWRGPFQAYPVTACLPSSACCPIRDCGTDCA